MMPLLALLIGCVALAYAVGDAPARATAIVLLANWCLNTAFVAVCGDRYPWGLFVTIDYLSAFVLIMMHRTALVKVIVVTYAVECIAHGAYGYVTLKSGNDYAGHLYWWLLYYVALLQTFIAGGTIAYQRTRHRSRAGGSVSFGEPGFDQGQSEGRGR